MAALTGLLFINTYDALATWGAFLCEDKQGDTRNYSALLKPAKAKQHTAVDFRENNGESYPASLTVKFEARDITLQFAIVASSKSDFFTKYTAFMTAVRNGVNGWVTLRLADIDKTFSLIYQDCTEYEQLTEFGGNCVAATFKVKFREPSPTF